MNPMSGSGYGHASGNGHGHGYSSGNGGGRNKSSPETRQKKRKRCPFTMSGIKEIDFKDVDLLVQFITEKGKILPRRITGVSAWHQKQLTQAIKRARHMAILPFVAES